MEVKDRDEGVMDSTAGAIDSARSTIMNLYLQLARTVKETGDLIAAKTNVSTLRFVDMQQASM